MRCTVRWEALRRIAILIRVLGFAAACGGAAAGSAPFDARQIGPRTTPVPSADYEALYHVSTGGSDATGDGTRGKPWSTLRHALERIGSAGPGRRHPVHQRLPAYHEQPDPRQRHHRARALPARPDAPGGERRR